MGFYGVSLIDMASWSLDRIDKELLGKRTDEDGRQRSNWKSGSTKKGLQNIINDVILKAGMLIPVTSN